MPTDIIAAPFVIMVVGAVLLPILPRSLRSCFALVIPVFALLAIWFLPSGVNLTVMFMNYELILVKVDSLSRGFGTIFSLITFIGSLFAFHLKDPAEQAAALLYAAGVLGVTFAGDFFSLLVFWELMSVPSLYLVWASRTRESRKAGMRYLIFHLFGGALLFAGILMRVAQTGGILIEQIPQGDSLSSWLIFAGVAVNAAVVPLHVWLPDAYPRATITGVVFLNSFTTKAAVYLLLRLFPGWEILIYLGVLMALYGVVYAVLANDIRGILSYHIISQIGYMAVGAGIGTPLAINGAAAHVFGNILFKSLLFMGAGSVVYATGKGKMSELGGMAKKQPLVLLLYMVGAFSISGFPFFNGFISKSMVMAAASEAHYTAIMFLLTLASVGTFLSVGLKLPFYTWFGERRKLSVIPVKPNMHFGMAVTAFFCILFGVQPDLLYRLLPYPVSFEPFSLGHITETLQLLIFTFAAFWLYRRKLSGHEVVALDMDWFYRRPTKLAQRLFLENVDGFFNLMEKTVMGAVRCLAAFGRNPYYFLQKDGGDKNYNPDRLRPSVGVLILLTLFCYLLFAAWGWLV